MRARTPRTLIALAAVALAACGGSTPANDDGGPPTPTAPSGRATDPASGVPGNDDAPVTVTIAGTTYGFPAGTCEVGDEVVQASAGGIEGEFGGVDLEWRSDGSVASFQVVNSGLVSAPPAPFELYADAFRTDSSWSVEVDGTTAVVEARMVNELPAARGDPARAEYDVTIRIDCTERGFGGMAPPATNDPGTATTEPMTEPTSGPAGEATITISLAGTDYAWPYAGCPIDEPAYAFILVDASGNRLVVTVGSALLALPDRTTWEASNVEFEVAGRTATWSGIMESRTAGSEAATITIAC